MLEKSTKIKWLIVGVISLLIILLSVAYGMNAIYYREHFYPGTTIDGMDFSGADQNNVRAGLMSEIQNYRLQVYGREQQSCEKILLAEISGEELDLQYLVQEAQLKELLTAQKSWLWIFCRPGPHTYTVQGMVEVDEEKLEAVLSGLDFCQEKNMTAPKDAYVEGYSEARHEFVLVPEVEGTQLDMTAVKEQIFLALEQQCASIDLEEQGCYVEPAVTVQSEGLQKSLADANKWLEAEICYDWNDNEVVLDGFEIRNWVILKNGKLDLDEQAAAEFVEKNAREYDTYGRTRIFHTTLGYDLSLPGGAFGWLTDREAETAELIRLIKAGTVGKREPIYTSKAPWKGGNDIGNSYVEADMTHQHLYLYQQGEVVLETDFVSGNMSNGCMTPEGVFGLTYKTTNAVLRGADYVTPVNYWMPFNGNVGMHDATWRDAFGGDIYLHNGSHGCLNLPLDKAEEIYGYLSEGFPVICYYYPPDVLQEPEEETDN